MQNMEINANMQASGHYRDSNIHHFEFNKILSGLGVSAFFVIPNPNLVTSKSVVLSAATDRKRMIGNGPLLVVIRSRRGESGTSLSIFPTFNRVGCISCGAFDGIWYTGDILTEFRSKLSGKCVSKDSITVKTSFSAIFPPKMTKQLLGLGPICTHRAA